MTTTHITEGSKGHSSDPMPRELTVAEFATIHAAYMDIASNLELSPGNRTDLAEGLNRVCVANPNAYAGFLEQQRIARESCETALSEAAMQEVYFHDGDGIGTVG